MNLVNAVAKDNWQFFEDTFFSNKNADGQQCAVTLDQLQGMVYLEYLYKSSENLFMFNSQQSPRETPEGKREPSERFVNFPRYGERRHAEIHFRANDGQSNNNNSCWSANSLLHIICIMYEDSATEQENAAPKMLSRVLKSYEEQGQLVNASLFVFVYRVIRETRSAFLGQILVHNFNVLVAHHQHYKRKPKDAAVDTLHDVLNKVLVSVKGYPAPLNDDDFSSEDGDRDLRYALEMLCYQCQTLLGLNAPWQSVYAFIRKHNLGSKYPKFTNYVKSWAPEKHKGTTKK